jgi:hypothetical protein
MIKKFHFGCAHMNFEKNNNLTTRLYCLETGFQGCVSHPIVMTSRLGKIMQLLLKNPQTMAKEVFWARLR